MDYQKQNLNLLKLYSFVSTLTQLLFCDLAPVLNKSKWLRKEQKQNLFTHTIQQITGIGEGKPRNMPTSKASLHPEMCSDHHHMTWSVPWLWLRGRKTCDWLWCCLWQRKVAEGKQRQTQGTEKRHLLHHACSQKLCSEGPKSGWKSVQDRDPNYRCSNTFVNGGLNLSSGPAVFSVQMEKSCLASFWLSQSVAWLLCPKQLVGSH